jgi:hypothetical protein
MMIEWIARFERSHPGTYWTWSTYVGDGWWACVMEDPEINGEYGKTVYSVFLSHEDGRDIDADGNILYDTLQQAKQAAIELACTYLAYREKREKR